MFLAENIATYKGERLAAREPQLTVGEIDDANPFKTSGLRNKFFDGYAAKKKLKEFGWDMENFQGEIRLSQLDEWYLYREKKIESKNCVHCSAD